MYDHINRFVNHPDEKIITSLDPILGGPGWQFRLDPTLKRGPAVEKLFRETLKAAGKFGYVASMQIDKSTTSARTSSWLTERRTERAPKRFVRRSTMRCVNTPEVGPRL